MVRQNFPRIQTLATVKQCACMRLEGVALRGVALEGAERGGDAFKICLSHAGVFNAAYPSFLEII